LSIYADTSFFVSQYVQDAHSAAADRLRLTANRVWFTPLHLVEWSHAVAAAVFRSRISPLDAAGARDDIEQDLAAGVWIRIGFPEAAFDRGADLARQHGPQLGVRTLDSLHVACALELNAERFWTFDERQAKLARAEGLKTN
jgi:predicted nucleic acid-binding protein